MEEGAFSGGINLTKSNYEVLNQIFLVDLICSLPKKTNLLNKVMRFAAVFGGNLGGNSVIFRRKLNSMLNEKSYDYVFIDHAQLGSLAQHIKKQQPNAKVIGSFQNIESEYINESMKLPGLVKSIFKWAAIANEKMLIKSADHIICLTEEDSSKIQELYGRAADVIIPITIKPKKFNYNVLEHPLPNLNQPYLLFCGSHFQPNVEAIDWFAKKVLGSISLQLVVIGNQMEKLRSQIKNPKLHIIGTVQELEPYYFHAMAIINPVSKGAGMNTKSVEAIGFGKKLLSTSFALRGFKRPLPNEITVCDTPEQFIENINKIHFNTTANQNLIDYYNQNFTPEKRLESIRTLLKFN